MQALYVHVPFCDSICAYCDFCRVKKQPILINKWLETLNLEIQQRLHVGAYDTLYIGGGTPSCLSYQELEKLLIALQPYQTRCVEYTIEVNPESLDLPKCTLLAKYGINRVSMGVQTTQPHLLQLIQRKHSLVHVTQCIQMLKAVGITNLSCDCMYSLPTQSLEDVKKTLDYFIEQNLPHISIYSLTIEPHSQFNRLGIQALDEDTEADYYQFIMEYLRKNDYLQYEISNFSKKGYESKHNLHYWHYDDFVGLSIGASGKENHQRYECTTNFETYFANNYISTVTKLTGEDERFEFVMMGLRLKEGILKQDFLNRFKRTFDACYFQVKKQLINEGLLIEEDKSIKCTERGYALLNEVLERFI